DRPATTFGWLFFDRPELDHFLFGEDERTHLRLQVDQHAGPTGFSVELAADGENGATKRLGVHGLASHAPVVTVLRTTLRPVRIASLRRELIRFGSEHETMDWFEMPAVSNQLTGEIIQKGLVGRALASGAEIRRGRDQPSPKMMLPEPVDNYAGGQRIVG